MSERTKLEEAMHRLLAEDEDFPPEPEVREWTREEYRQAASALYIASERIGMHNAPRYQKLVKRSWSGKITQTYCISEAHQKVQDALHLLERRKIDPGQAMAVLHEGDVQDERAGRLHGVIAPRYYGPKGGPYLIVELPDD